MWHCRVVWCIEVFLGLWYDWKAMFRLTYSKEATRWLPYIVGVIDGERGDFLHIQPVDILLEQTKQGQVEGGQPGLLALENKSAPQQNISRSRKHIRCWSEAKMQETEVWRHCLPWRCSGHQMCASPSGSSAHGWISDESPWTPAELHWPPWAAARPGSGSYRSHPSASNPAGGLRGRKRTMKRLGLADRKASEGCERRLS